jgi:hypothetical protein
MTTLKSIYKTFSALCLLGLAAGLLSGCASTKVSDRQIYVTEKLPRPAHIWIYDFTTSPTNVPAESALAGKEAEPQTAEQNAEAQQVGAEIANQLATQISALGLPAQVAWTETKPAVNDIVIRGYLISVVEGSTAKRMTLGFGSGNSKLQVAVEAFQVTPTGVRKLGSGDVGSGGAKGPGMAVGAAVFLATANPVGLIVSGGTKIYGEASGKSKISGRAEATVKEIMEQAKPRFQAMGWIN